MVSRRRRCRRPPSTASLSNESHGCCSCVTLARRRMKSVRTPPGEDLRVSARYGRPHRRMRALLLERLRREGVLFCWRCSGEIVVATDLHVGHDDWDLSVTRGPEHVLCNLRAAAAKRNGTAHRPRSRDW